MTEVNKIEIRAAKEYDILKIYSMEREYIKEHEIEQLYKWDRAKAKNIKLLMDNINRMFVVSKDEKIWGHCYWSIYKEVPCIYSIYISQNHRKQGLATLLMNKIEEQILENNYRVITLSTLETNPAKYLFENMNYKEINREDGWINFSKCLDR